jgi:hypothetical protein
MAHQLLLLLLLLLPKNSVHVTTIGAQATWRKGCCRAHGAAVRATTHAVVAVGSYSIYARACWDEGQPIQDAAAAAAVGTTTHTAVAASWDERQSIKNANPARGRWWDREGVQARRGLAW